MQFFPAEIRSGDFAYFLHRLDQGILQNYFGTVLYFMDRAPAHFSAFNRQGSLSAKIQYGLPGWPQLNLIENSFSYIRNKFRSRPIVETLQEEMLNFILICNDNNENENFDGYYLNYLREALYCAKTYEEELNRACDEFEEITVTSSVN